MQRALFVGSSYHQEHAQFKKSALWMDSLARSEHNAVEIDLRIAYLRKAVASAEKCSAVATVGVTSGVPAEQLQDMRDALEVAGAFSDAFHFK